MQQNKKYWEDIAKKYNDVVGESGDIRHESVVNPVVFELLGDLSEKEVLDAGCGNGYLARRMAKTAKRVVGIDLTEELIELANRKENPSNVEFQVANLENIPFEDETFDIVLNNLVLVDVEDLNIVVSELARVLKKGGKLVVSTLHPCFENPSRAYSLYNESNTKKIGRVVQRYFDTGLIIDENQKTESGQVYQHYHYTISDYLNAFSGAGLILRRTIEPNPNIENQKIIDHTPTFLIFQFNK